MRKRSPAKLNTNQPQHSKLNYFLAVILILTVFGAGGILFKVQQIKCLVDGQPNPELCEQLSFLKNKSLFFTRFDQTPLFLSTLVNEQGQVFEPLQIQKRLPDTLLISFLKKDPSYKIKIDQQTYIVNSQGYLAQDSNQFDLPLITMTEAYQNEISAEKIDLDLHQTITDYVEYFNQQELDYNDFKLNKKESSVTVNNTDYIFEDTMLPALTAMKVKLISDDLAKIKQDLTADQEIRVIDLRFDLPVVKIQES